MAQETIHIVPAKVESETDEFVPDSAEIKADLARTVHRGLPASALTLSFVYAGLTLAHMAVLPPEIGLFLVPTAAVSALFFLIMVWLTSSGILGESLAQPVSWLFGLVPLFNSLLHLALTGDPLQSTNIMLVMLVTGALYLSWLWFGLIAALSVIGWIMIMLVQPFTDAWLHFSFAMALTLVMAIVIQRLRISAYSNLYKLQQQNNQQKERLVDSQGQLEDRVARRTQELGLANESLQAEVIRRQKIEEELKKSESALKKDRSDLELEVARRTAELRKANIELEHAARLKDEFLANMSHELRTPLNAILGNSEILSEELYGEMNDRQHAAVRRVDDSGRHLLGLINDVLDVSKIGAGKLDLSLAPVNVGALCRASMAMVRTEAMRKQIDLSLILDPAVKMIVADGRRLKQVLVNLLSNAVKFTPNDGRAGLIVRGRAGESKVHLMVWDTGIGISEEEIDQLFKPFIQLDSSLAKEHAGTGLGLALSQQLVTLHKGTIGVKSQPGKGSLFVVTLPWSLETRIGSRPSEDLEPEQVASASTLIDAPTYIFDSENKFEPPFSGDPHDLADWITQSPDSQSPFEPLESTD